MDVVSSSPGLHFYRNNKHIRIARASLVFMILTFTMTHFSPTSWLITNASSVKGFIPDCAAISAQHI
jgi:hypothetical protein